MSGKMNNTVVSAYYAGNKVDIPIKNPIQYPKTPEELQQFLMLVFGNEAYAVLAGLSYLKHKVPRDSFEVKVRCPQFYPNRFGGGSR